MKDAMSVFLENQIIGGPAQHMRVRPVLVAAMSVLLVVTAVGRAGTVRLADYYDSENLRAAATLSVPHRHDRPASDAGTSAPVPTQTSGVSAGAVVPSCAPDTSYSLPGNLALGDAPAGLSVQVDPIHYYKIYGLDSSEVRQQIINCAPNLGGGADYTGYTTYSLSWRYDYLVSGAGQCAIGNAKVGLHISEVLPAWQSAAQAPASYGTAWQRFITSLDTHEQGHVAFDKQYAAQALADLQNLPAAPCDQISAMADAAVKADLAALNQANDNYDAVTNHGATQGAILP